MADPPGISPERLLELVEKAKLGDTHAYDALCLALSAQLCTFLWRMLENEQDARDTTQEALLTAWIELPTLREDNHFKTWLYRIAINKANACIRKNRRFRWLSWEEHEQLDAADRLSMNDISVQLAESELMKRALEYLAPTYRACVLLQVVGKFKQREIAEILQIPIGNVGNNVRRGLERLSQAYQALSEEQHRSTKRGSVL